MCQVYDTIVTVKYCGKVTPNATPSIYYTCGNKQPKGRSLLYDKVTYVISI